MESVVQPMIAVDHLSRDFGDVHAVDDVSFSLAAGETFGLLGHNGAGKTTTIRMLTGRTHPTKGQAPIGGYDVLADFNQIKPLINVVFEDQYLGERLSGRDILRLFAALSLPMLKRAETHRSVAPGVSRL